MCNEKCDSKTPTRSKGTWLRSLITPAIVIAVGVLVLLLPALIYGRPFIYFDTWAFYGWGHDILAAIRHPWPSSGPFPTGRELWIIEGLPSGATTVDETHFRLLMSQIGARSAFYAVPLFALGSLWLAAIAQATLVSWVLWMTICAYDLQPRTLAFVVVVASLTAGTTLPFVAAFIMPDVFGGIVALSAGLILFFPERLTGRQRWALLTLILYGVLAHTSNIALLLMAILLGALITRLTNPRRAAIHQIGLLGGLFVAALVLLTLGSQGLKAVFGRPAQNPPFLLGRVIADGPGLEFLKERCERSAFVACELKDPEKFGLSKYRGDDLIFPDLHYGPQPFSARTDPDRRERFYAEAPEIILGAIARDPIGQLRASLRNGMQQIVTFGIRDMFEPLPWMLSRATVLSDRLASVTPNVAACKANHGHGCDMSTIWRMLSRWHKAVVAVAALILVFRLTPILVSRARRSALSPEHSFAVFVILMVLGNAFACGVGSLPLDRFQARVVWLVPFAALMLESRYGYLQFIFNYARKRFRWSD
jgi:hypothetical protein